MDFTITIDNDFKKVYEKMNVELLDIEGISMNHLDIIKGFNCFFNNKRNAIIDENANALSENNVYGIYQAELTKPLQKLAGYNRLYVKIKELYGKAVADMTLEGLFSGDMYLHDSCFIDIPYCWATSVYSLVHFGIKDNAQLESFPPKKRRSFIDMVKEFVIQLSHAVAGAVAISDLFVYYSYYVQLELDIFRKEQGLSNNLTYTQLLGTKLRKEIEDDFQSLVHTLNMNLRSCSQSPFTNVSIFDMANLKLLFSETEYPNGTHPDLDLVMEIQKIFCDWFRLGDPIRKLPYRFPVCTLNIRIDENKQIIDEDTFKYFCEINTGNSPFNVYISSGHKIASCCRLLSSYENQCDSMGNGGISLGSVRVCTLNLPRVGHLVKLEHEKVPTRNIYEIIDEKLEYILKNCEVILRSHRRLIEEHVKNKFLPFFENGILDLHRMFCTFGINGIYECVNEITGDPISKEGAEYYKYILSKIHEYTKSISKNGVLFNCEEVPAESLASKVARKDHVVYGMNYDIYSNQFVPLSYEIDIHERIKYEGMFSKYLSGGCITHLNMMEKISSAEQMRIMMMYIIQNGVEHFAINYNFCKCKNNHITTNKPGMLCKECGEKVDEYTRIIGYFVPVAQFSSGRKKEHSTRKFY